MTEDDAADVTTDDPFGVDSHRRSESRRTSGANIRAGGKVENASKAPEEKEKIVVRKRESNFAIDDFLDEMLNGGPQEATMTAGQDRAMIKGKGVAGSEVAAPTFTKARSNTGEGNNKSEVLMGSRNGSFSMDGRSSNLGGERSVAGRKRTLDEQEEAPSWRKLYRAGLGAKATEEDGRATKFAKIGTDIVGNSMVETIRQEVNRQKGTFYESRSGLLAANGGLADRKYLVMPFKRASESDDVLKHAASVRGTGIKVVSEYWFERCIECNQILNPSDSAVFAPLECRTPLSDFTHTIGVSGYDGLERALLGRLATVLGANFTEHFSRKNTVLIYRPGTEMASVKWKKAKEWGIPVVAGWAWLEECVRQEKAIDPRSFGDSPVSVSIAESRQQSSRNVHKSAPVGTPAPTWEDTTLSQQVVQPTQAAKTGGGVLGRSMSNTGFEGFRPRFDVADALKGLETPRGDKLNNMKFNPLNTENTMSPLDESYAKHVGRAIENLNRGIVTDTNSKHSNTSSTNSQPQPAEDLNAPSDVLNGVVICVSARLSHRKRELHQMAMDMGANVLMVYSNACTHYIHQSNKKTETFKEFKEANKARKWIVSPFWLQKCQALRQRANEAEYPHTLDPNRSLEVSGMVGPMDPERMSMSSQRRRSEAKSSAMNSRSTSPARGSMTPSKNDGVGSQGGGPEDGAAGGGEKKKHSPVAEQFAAKVEGLSEKMKEEKFRRRPRPSVTSNNVTPILKTSVSRLSSSSGYDGANTVIDGGNDGNEMEVDYGQSVAAVQQDYTLTQLSQKSTSGNGKRQRGELVGGRGDDSIDEGEHSVVVYDDVEGRLERSRLMEIVGRNQKRMRTESNASSGMGVVGPGDVTPIADEEDGGGDGKGEGKGGNAEVEENVKVDLFGGTGVRREGSMNEKTASRMVRRDSVSTTGGEQTTPVIGGKDLNGNAKRGRMPALLPIPHANNAEGRRSVRSSIAHAPPTTTPTIATKRFLLTGLPMNDRPRYAAIVRRLGGKVIDSEFWNDECTHLVVGKPNRTEKCLAGIASGVWWLKSGYLDECGRVGGWVDEEKWEWAGDADGGSQNDNMLRAPKRWRLKLQNFEHNGKRRGAYDNWKVLLFVDAKKRDGFMRVLRAGGADVVVGKAPFRGVEDEEFTHCLTDKTAEWLSAHEPLIALAKSGTVFVGQAYCAEYLIKDPTPNVESFRIKVGEK
ncbi:DNA topoisomerase 2-binding protein 1 [Rhizophlyctis rosea]|nr:DNA topoisomerase 2-binding protein 1 [Rhizophlyctis rosea]